MAPGGTLSVSVLRHRSHIRHRQGHSRFVRKMVATETISPAAVRSSSTRNAYGRRESRTWRCGLSPRIQRSRSNAFVGYGDGLAIIIDNGTETAFCIPLL